MTNKPMEHQSKALAHRKKRPTEPTSEDVMAWLMDKGTGKSYVILKQWTDGLNDGTYDGLIVIAPAGSFRNWFEDKSEDQKSEINAHLDPKLLEKMCWAAWTKGAESRKKREILLKKTNVPRAFFANVEGLSVENSRLEKYLHELMKTGRWLLAVDESTCIRGRKAERRKALFRLRVHTLAGRGGRAIATGLVTPKSPMDLYWQFAFLDWKILGFETQVGFRNNFAEVEYDCFMPKDLIKHRLRKKYETIQGQVKSWHGTKLRKECEDLSLIAPGGGLTARKAIGLLRDHYTADNVELMGRDAMITECQRLNVYLQLAPRIKEFKNLDQLQKLIKPYSYRVLKDDCLDLDPKIYTVRDVEMTDEQSIAYRELIEYATTQIGGGHVVATTAVSMAERMHQILCGFVKDENNQVRYLKSNRLDQLMEVLEDHSGKRIIWSAYREEVKLIVDRLSEEYGPDSVAQFHGGNKSTRHLDEKRFLSDPRCVNLVATQKAGGKGNTWTVADLTIYSSNNFDLEDRDQSEDRNHRKGQKKSVTYVDLVARGTVDEKIVRALRRKIDVATAITGENFREWVQL